jgi:hypothetical protein
MNDWRSRRLPLNYGGDIGEVRLTDPSTTLGEGAERARLSRIHDSP